MNTLLRKVSWLVLPLMLMTTMSASFAQATTLSDIAGHPYQGAIETLMRERMISGYPDGTFRPNREINRAEFLKLALGARSDFSVTDTQSCVSAKKTLGWEYMYFRDVAMDTWYAPYVCYAYEKKLISGYADGTFRPGDTVNFPEMAKMIVGGLGYGVRAASADEQWYMPYLEVLEKRMSIPTSITFISALMKRGEVAEVIYRMIKSPELKASESMTLRQLRVLPELSEPQGGLGSIRTCGELAYVIGQTGAFDGGYPTPWIKSSEERALSTDSSTGAVAEQAPAPTANGGGSDDFSTTNIQVEGVDEADIVKNDGEFIYIVKNETVRIVKAYPASSMAEVGRLTFTEKDFYPQEIYVHGDTLVILGSSYSFSVMPVDSARMIMPRPPMSSKAQVIVVNIKDKSKPAIERTVMLEGNYSQSRRIGDVLYMVINTYPDFYTLQDQGLPIEKTLPMLTDTAAGKTTEARYDCQQVKYFPGFEQAQYLTVAGIPLDRTTQPVTRQVFLGSSENVYMSTKALYVATGVRDQGDMFWNYNNTMIYKFGVEGTLVTFKGTGKVPGRVLNQFSMDESGDTFRIATTIPQDWQTNEPSKNALYVLDSGMKIVGKVENIAPGETIHSVRFMGSRAYMVTFRTVDPFFVVDLKDPMKPTILGELKIPGWSDYLHPYDEYHVIGFGKEVNAEAAATNDALAFTAIAGMKMSLFDVRDPANPVEKFKEVIGERGTDSEVLRNHKALLFDREKNLLAFPVTLYTERPQEGDRVWSEWEKYYPSFYGATVYSIDVQNGFKKRGMITHVNMTEPDPDTWWYADYERIISRILYIGKSIYSVSPEMIKASDIDTVAEQGTLLLK